MQCECIEALSDSITKKKWLNIVETKKKLLLEIEKEMETKKKAYKKLYKNTTNFTYTTQLRWWRRNNREKSNYFNLFEEPISFSMTTRQIYLHLSFFSHSFWKWRRKIMHKSESTRKREKMLSEKHIWLNCLMLVFVLSIFLYFFIGISLCYVYRGWN